jgi:AcrR family transcriptional regulator
MTRTYQLKRRAQLQEETRQRIVEATVHLHETLGPAHTSISAIAEQAGVERLTVYRHFPDEQTLFTACTSHYLAAHPLPDPSDWMQIADPEMRLRVALTEAYAYYQRTERMLSRSLPDLPDMPVVQRILEPYFAYWEQVRDGLAEGWGTQGRQNARLRAVLAHLLDFRTWYAFVRQERLSDDELVELMVQFVRCLVSGPKTVRSSQVL